LGKKNDNPPEPGGFGKTNLKGIGVRKRTNTAEKNFFFAPPEIGKKFLYGPAKRALGLHQGCK